MNSIRIKLVSICVAVVLIVMSISGSFMLISVRSIETWRIQEQLEEQAIYIEEEIVQRRPVDEWADAFEQTRGQHLRSPHGIQVVILSGIGTPLVPQDMVRFNFNDTAVFYAMGGEPSFANSVFGEDFNGREVEWLAFAMPVEKDGTMYIVYTRMSAEPLNENLAQLTTSVVLMVLMALVFTVLLWFLFANTITRPIVALIRHHREMAEGHLDKELPVYSRDEIGQLTESFNHMAKELNTMVSAIALEKNKHEAVLHNMTDGVLAYDSKWQNMHANMAANVLLQFDDMERMSMGEMLKRLELDAEAVEGLTADEVLESTIAIEENDRYIRSSCSPYTNQSGAVDGFVIVLQDITKQAKLDNMRREFVANVSHELRTPLASICSYSETLLDGALEDPDMAVDFLQVIDTEARRMSFLVTDLLELSRLDNNPHDMELEVVDLVGLTKMAVRHSLVAAEEKNQQIVFHAPDRPYFIEVVPTRMNQVLVNVLSNSIKYSRPETSIEVDMEETENDFQVKIQDYGMGISKADLANIFERFYRVDKARSRAMGGTGLGLAIAKEIMEAHGGGITVTSELGVGTLMVLRFNKYVES